MEEKIKKVLPGALFGENSGLPYIAFPISSTDNNLRSIEKILFLLHDFGAQAYPILLDFKDGLIMLRFAVTVEQKQILNSTRS